MPGASGEPGFKTVTTPASIEPIRATERAMSVDSFAAAALVLAEPDGGVAVDRHRSRRTPAPTQTLSKASQRAAAASQSWLA